MKLLDPRIVIVLALAGCVEAGEPGKPGADGVGCTVLDNLDGTKTISCAEGTQVTVSDGLKGDKGEPGEPGEPGADGQDCSVEETGDDVYTITCGEVDVVVSDGDDGAAGEKGETGEQGNPGSNGHNSLVELSEIEPGDDVCPAGGQLVTVGVDLDDSGTLEVEENPVTTVVCARVEDEDSVCAGNSAPVINWVTVNGLSTGIHPTFGGSIGTQFEVQIHATDADGDPLSYSISGGSMKVNEFGEGGYGFTGYIDGTFYFTAFITDGCQMAMRNFAVIIHSTDSVLYSGPDRNVVYSKQSHPGV
ncbi:MAG TPA: hypothetical protein PKG98_13435, partial [Myxococcota bacterium]|nr:hypothetical protein [Myxococcota bacterium]